MPEVYKEDLHDPAAMERRAQDEVSDEEFAKEGFMVGADPAEHVERLRDLQGLGATVLCLQLIGADEAVSSIERYGREVLPPLRD